MSIQAPSSHLRAVACALFLGLGGALQADVPEATITSPASAITVAGGQVVAFTATSTDSVGYDTYTVTSYTWDFGDGTTGAGATTTHAYASDGVRTVTLTVAYRGATLLATYPRIKTVVVNKTATATRTVTVLAPPSIGSFSASSTSVGVGKPVTLSWTTTNATSLSVTGVGSVAGNTTVVYPTATTTYTLTAANAAGSTSAAVTVTTYTVGVSLSPGSATLRLGEAATFQAAVVPANQGVSWSAPGATLTSATGTSVLFTGGTTGTYLLRASSLEDPAQSATATVVVLPVSIGTPVATPSDARALQGGTVGFTALVSNAVNTAVSWSVNGGGTISSNGLFTASQLGIWTVTATSQADPSKSASTSVQVVPLVVTVSPATATVRSGQTQAFSAGVTGAGTPSQLVTWWVDGVAGGNGTLGTITSAGVYTAPSVPGNHTIQARSLLDGTQGTATVQMATWTLRWKKDIVYLGTKEVAEIDQDGVHVTLVDHLGSPRYEVRADQTIVEQKFAPFGESLTDPTTAGKFAKGFTNHEQTDPSGLIYMQARFYAPWYGRFLSPDPARDQHFEETQSWNIYSYVQNNPTMNIDPNGQQAVAATAGVLGTGALAVTAPAWVGPALIVGGVAFVGYQGYQLFQEHFANKANATPAPAPGQATPVEDVLKDAKPGDGKGGPAKVGPQDKPVDQWNKPGGMDQANKDFDKVAKPDTVVDKGGGVRVGEAVGEPAGTKVVVRPKSTTDPKTKAPGPPTVEVQRPKPPDAPKPPDTKIRYPKTES